MCVCVCVCAYHNKKCEVDLNETRLKFTANNYTQRQHTRSTYFFLSDNRMSMPYLLTSPGTQAHQRCRKTFPKYMVYIHMACTQRQKKKHSKPQKRRMLEIKALKIYIFIGFCRMEYHLYTFDYQKEPDVGEK